MEDAVARRLAFIICMGFLIIQAQQVGARGGRGGGGARGGRGGGSRYGRSGSYSRSPAQYRAYRTSGGYSGYSTRRYNYYGSNSYYLNYVPGVRYTRSYTAGLMGAVYWGYYSRYYYYSNSAIYARRSQPSSHTTSSVCANYAAGENSTYLGLFVCPLGFEPETYTACCGDDYEEYCCQEKKGLSVTAIVLIVIGCLLAVAAICYLIYYCIRRNKASKNAVNEGTANSPGQTGNRPPGNQPPGNRPPGNRPPGNQPPGNQPPGLPAYSGPNQPPNFNYNPRHEGITQSQGQANGGTQPVPGKPAPIGFENMAYQPPPPQQEPPGYQSAYPDASAPPAYPGTTGPKEPAIFQIAPAPDRSQMY